MSFPKNDLWGGAPKESQKGIARQPLKGAATGDLSALTNGRSVERHFESKRKGLRAPRIPKEGLRGEQEQLLH